MRLTGSVARNPLPIDAYLPEVGALLSPEGAELILEAPPGAGKTTRLPAHLLEQPWCKNSILVSEPRRIAARLSATRVAFELGEKIGKTVGYRVRFDEKTGPDTRLIYMTEGLLLRQLLANESLAGVSAIVLDEVHERSADLDVLLALLKTLKRTAPHLRIVLMSATLDGGLLERYFPEAQSLRSPGQSFEVDIHHASKDDERPLPIRVRSALKQGLHLDGDILVFLPGAGEIRSCQSALTELPHLDIVPLYGDLPLNEQVRAMTRGDRRRVILSTNVAESSVTIPGVTTVIDSGLARSAVFDRWSGVSRLETIEISQARCIQRAGRAGRVAPGQTFRLFTKGNFAARPAQDVPELLRSDLSSVLLLLLAAGKSQHTLDFLASPEPSAWDQAEHLLAMLGAMHADNLSETGRILSMLPLPPRLARVALEGARLGILDTACNAAALLAERDIAHFARRYYPGGTCDLEASDSDIEDRLERLASLVESGFDRSVAKQLDVDVHTARSVAKSAHSIMRSLQKYDKQARSQQARGSDTHALGRALLSGFVDRVAERRQGSRDLVLSNGTQATLHPTSSVVSARLLIALSADSPTGKQRKAQVRLACRLEPDWLFDAAPDLIQTSEEVTFNPSHDRVEQVSRLTFGKVTLDETKSLPSPSPATEEVLVRAALSKGAASYDPQGRLESLFVRVSLTLLHLPQTLVESSDEERSLLSSLFVDETLSEERFSALALHAAASTRTSLAALAEAQLDEELTGFLPRAITRALAVDFPKEVKLHGGRVLPVHYEKGRTPWIESRLQDFFSMTKGPTLCRGRLPLQLQLLAPNHRALQVTTDLEGFWLRHYPDLRKQLMRRYPKHLWPEDGRTAKPPTPGKIR